MEPKRNEEFHETLACLEKRSLLPVNVLLKNTSSTGTHNPFIPISLEPEFKNRINEKHSRFNGYRPFAGRRI